MAISQWIILSFGSGQKTFGFIMLDNKSFREEAHKLVDWMADYMESVTENPVKSQVKPGEIINQLPAMAPTKGESFSAVFEDFKKIIIPGITHWQSPNFHAYFPGNSSYPSILGEMLTSTIAAQCMIWETSPAAAELEERVMDWLKSMIGMPEAWTGCIQDTASTATLAALLCAREHATNHEINKSGFYEIEKLRFYCSKETHSSIDKAVKILGGGASNLVKVASDDQLAIIPEDLERCILEDIKKGYQPAAVVAAIGTTGTLAIDPVRPIGQICQKHKIWLHVDAAYAGTALLLPEYRWMIDGVELADSFVFNPHKWMFTNFDCTAYLVRDKEALIRTFEILPEYLKTGTRGKVNDYRDWGIPLGRRFRALKLWFVIRDFGVEGLQQRLRDHISYANWLADQITNHEAFETVIEPTLNLVCFRYNPGGLSEERLEVFNSQLMQSINSSGKAYMTHTKVHGRYAIRMVMGQTYLQEHHIRSTWDLIQQCAQSVSDSFDMAGE